MYRFVFLITSVHEYGGGWVWISAPSICNLHISCQDFPHGQYLFHQYIIFVTSKLMLLDSCSELLIYLSIWFLQHIIKSSIWWSNFCVKQNKHALCFRPEGVTSIRYKLHGKNCYRSDDFFEIHFGVSYIIINALYLMGSNSIMKSSNCCTWRWENGCPIFFASYKHNNVLLISCMQALVSSRIWSN
jgi:hypothetical protein